MLIDVCAAKIVLLWDGAADINQIVDEGKHDEYCESKLENFTIGLFDPEDGACLGEVEHYDFCVGMEVRWWLAVDLDLGL